MLDTDRLEPQQTPRRTHEPECSAPGRDVRRAESLRRADFAAKLEVEVHLAVHDLRNSLSSAALNASLLARRIGGLDADATNTELLECVRRELRHVHDTLERVIELTEDEATVAEPVDVTALMADVQRLARAAAQLAGDVRIIATPPKERMSVRGSRGRLQQAIFALVRNAIEASCSNGGEVHIEVDALDSEVYIRVRDNGLGLPPDLRVQDYEEFESTKPAGLGLGLFVARTIITQHAGSLSLTSTPGSGACAEIRVPRSSDAPQS